MTSGWDPPAKPSETRMGTRKGRGMNAPAFQVLTIVVGSSVWCDF